MSARLDRKQAPRAASKVVSAVVLLAGLLALFFVPYRFPHPDGHSQSYMAHFSNRAAQVVLFTCMLALGWGTDVFGLHYPVPRAEAVACSRWPLFLLAGISTAFAGVLWFLERPAGASGEVLYFLDRYAAHDLGAPLYRGMEFSYGPLLFWPQLWASGLLHLSRGDAHFLLFTLEWPAGITLLWYLCRRLGQTNRVVTSLFLLLGYIWIDCEVTGGLNYTPLRFLAAPALALHVDLLLRSGASPWRVYAWASAGFALLLFFSPEQGIAFAFATVVLLGVCVPDSRLQLPLLTFAATASTLIAAAYHFGVLDTLLNIGGGLLDFPLLPSTRSLVLLIGATLGGALGFAALRRRQLNRPELYLTLLTFALVPAALGRSDPGHVFINLLPLLAIAFCAMSATRRGYQIAVGGLLLFGLLIMKKATIPGVQAVIARYRHPNDPALVQARQEPDDRGPYLAPFGYARDFARAAPRLIYVGRYPSYLELMGQREIAIKIEELAARPGVPLLLPADAIPGACITTDTKRRNDLNSATRPWFIPRLRQLDRTSIAMCDYIAVHYRKTALQPPAPGYEIWMPLR